MDLKGSLVDTNLKIIPSKTILEYIKTITIDDDVPENIVKLVKGENYEVKNNRQDAKSFAIHFTDKDIENMNTILNAVGPSEIVPQDDVESKEIDSKDCSEQTEENSSDKEDDASAKNNPKQSLNIKKAENKEESESEPVLFLLTSDIDWLYTYLQSQKKNAVDVPYLHELLDGATIEMPENKTIKRNPVLEARCVKLRAQQEAREYRKMTKTVDNVRMRFPEDSISYQLKQVNRQLIAVGQFIISIFAGFLFGFRGVEWIVGNLDFGFRLLLGVMCALVIALAEIYFLAKKLNEELNIPETIQLGGPPKFVNEPKCYDYVPKIPSQATMEKVTDKEHQD